MPRPAQAPSLPSRPRFRGPILAQRHGRDAAAPRFRPLTQAQQADVTTLHNNGRGLDFYALCRVVRDAHPLSIFVFLRNEVTARGWWMRACAGCATPFATPRPSVRFCAPGCGVNTRELALA